MKARVDWTGPGIALGAFLLRLAPWRAVFSSSGVLFVDVDDWNHLRRMLVAARDFPTLSVMDRYFAHPDGFLTNWPPFHDWLVGGLIRSAWAVSPGIEPAAVVAAFVPPVLGALTIYLFHRFAAAVLPAKSAAVAAILAAVLPSPLFYTVLGRPDHHCSEMFWFLLAAVFLLPLSEKGERRGAVCAALALAAGWLSWSGFAVFEAGLFAWLAWETRRLPQARSRNLPLVFALQIPVLLAFTALNPFVRALNFDFDLPGLFAPAACTVMAVALQALRRRSLPWGAAAFILGAPLLWLVTPSIGRFVGALPRVMHLFTELQPLFKPYGSWSLSAAQPWLGWTPLVLPLLAYDFILRRGATAAGRLAVLYCAIFAVLAFAQTRYVMHFSFAVALLVAGSLDRFHRFNASLVVALLLLLPALKNSAALPFVDAVQIVGNPEIREVCEWIRVNTPPTRSRDRDEGVAEYGVFADLNLAPMVAALAERPAAGANNHAMKDAMNWTIQLFLRDEVPRVHAELRAKGFRYVLLGAMNDGGLYFTYLGLTAIPQAYWEPRRARMVFFRLYRSAGDTDLKKAFRLVHESPGGAYRVFQVLD